MFVCFKVSAKIFFCASISFRRRSASSFCRIRALALSFVSCTKLFKTSVCFCCAVVPSFVACRCCPNSSFCIKSVITIPAAARPEKRAFIALNISVNEPNLSSIILAHIPAPSQMTVITMNNIISNLIQLCFDCCVLSSFVLF